MVGSILLFPQGLVPLVAILSSIDVKPWFLAMYVTSEWGLLIAAISALAEIFLYARAIFIEVKRRSLKAQGEVADVGDHELERA